MSLAAKVLPSVQTDLPEAPKVDGRKPLDRERLRQAARDFESVFMEIVLRSMRKTVPKSELMNGGNAEDIYRSMLDSEYAKSYSQGGNSGLAESIERELLQKMGIKELPPSPPIAGRQPYRKV